MLNIRKIAFVALVFGLHIMSSAPTAVPADVTAAISKVLKLGFYISDFRPPMEAKQDGSSVKLGDLGLIHLDPDSIKNLAKADKNDTNIPGVTFKPTDPNHSELFKSVTVQKKSPSNVIDNDGNPHTGEWFQATIPSVSLKIFIIETKAGKETEKQIGKEQTIGYGEGLYKIYKYPNKPMVEYSISFQSQEIFMELLKLSKSSDAGEISITVTRTLHLREKDKIESIQVKVSKIAGNPTLKLTIPSA